MVLASDHLHNFLNMWNGHLAPRPICSKEREYIAKYGGAYKSERTLLRKDSTFCDWGVFYHQSSKTSCGIMFFVTWKSGTIFTV